MKTVKNTLTPCLGLILLLFWNCSSTSPNSGCGSNSSSVGIPVPNYWNRIIIYNIPLKKENDLIKVTVTPLDKISKEVSFFQKSKQIKGLRATIYTELFPYDFKNPNGERTLHKEILGQERKFNFELRVADKLILQKIITVKSEKNPNKAPWCLETDKLEVDNMDYVTKIIGKNIYIDFKKK